MLECVSGVAVMSNWLMATVALTVQSFVTVPREKVLVVSPAVPLV